MAGNRTDRDPPGMAIAALARLQHGVVDDRDLRALGLERRAVRRRMQAGWLHPVHPGVYSVGHTALSLRGRYLAAVKACGPGAVLSHRSAAELWGLRPSSGRIEVTVRRVNRRVPGIKVYRSRMLAPQDRAKREGVPVTSVARTLLDLTGVVPFHHLAKALDRAERAGISDLKQLEEVLGRARGKPGAKALRQGIEAWRPSHTKSGLEDRFAALVERAALPKPELNKLVDGEQRQHEVDAFWPEHRLAVQVDSWQWHRTRRDKEHDAASDADLELAGVQVVRLSEHDLTIRSQATARRLEARLPAP